MEKEYNRIVRLLIFLQLLLTCQGLVYLYAGYNIFGSCIILLSLIFIVFNIKTLKK